MDEYTLIEKYFKKLTYKNPSALKLNDDVFFDKKNNVVISINLVLIKRFLSVLYCLIKFV